MIRFAFVLTVLVALIVAGCDSTTTPVHQTLELSFSGVEPLQNGYFYEGWAIIDGQPRSTGRFNVDDQSRPVDPQGQAISGGRFETGLDLSRAAAIVITIEPPGAGPEPSDTKFLAGDVSGTQAGLAATHMAALGDDFAGAAGGYILATPTAPEAPALSGIWFIDPTGQDPAPSLSLPQLPEGWIYEGWVVIDGQPVTTGKFREVTGADMDAPFSGPEPGPPFPGEDFVTNAPPGLTFPTDLSGRTAVISIEPWPDDHAAPFALKPLAGMIPATAEPMTLYGLDNQRNTFPAGTARFLE